MRFIISVVALSFVQQASTATPSAKLQVLVISSLHGMHANHDYFTYDDLYAAVASFTPDKVGVEIRAEDIGADVKYLKSNYPSEMITLMQGYSDRVFGFDWLGDDIVGQHIPADYWATLDMKVAARQLESDKEQLAKRPAELDDVERQQRELLKVSDINDMMDGTYGELCRKADALQLSWLANTPYESILRFNERRDKKIGDAIVAELKALGSGRVVLVMGADHRTFAVERLQEEFGKDIVIITKVP